MRLIKWYISIFLSTITLFVFGQKPYIKQYTVENGLPINEIFQVYQDSKGYIWVATSTGVCKFNGSEFILVENKTNFKNIFVNEIKEDKRGQMWFVSLLGSVYVQKKCGEIVAFPFNKSLSDKLNSNKGHIKFSFKPLSDSSLIISLKDKGTFYIDKKGIIRNEYMNFSNLVFDFKGDSPFISSQKMNVADPFFYVINTKGKVLKAPMDNLPTHMFAKKLHDNTMLASLDKYLYVIKGESIKKYEMEDAVTGISEDKSKNIWINMNGLGASKYTTTEFDKKPTLRVLEGETVTTVIQDMEGAYWLSTLNSGLYYIPSMAIMNFTKEDGLATNKIAKVFCQKNKVWIGYYDGFISLIDNNQVVKNFKSFTTYNSYVKGIDLGDDSSIYVSSERLYKITNGRVENVEEQLIKSLHESRNKFSLLPRNVVPSSDGGFWLSSNRGFRKIKNGKIVFDSYLENIYSGISYTCAEDSKGGLYIGGNSLMYFKDGRFTNLGKKSPYFDVVISRIYFDKKSGQMLLATKGQGILIVQHGKVYQISTAQGLSSSNVTSLFVDGNKFWVGSNKGVDCVKILDYNNYRFSIKKYTSTHGLVSDDVRDIYSSGRYVYIATSAGLSRLDLQNDLVNSLPPKVIVSSFKVNEKDTTFSKHLKLGYTQNFIDVAFDALTYKREKNIYVRYKLEGLSPKWYYTSDTRLRFYKLAPGDYTLYIQAENNDGVWTSDSATVSFSIDRPFWMSYWFFILSLVLVGSIVFAIMRTRLIVARKLNLNERKANMWKNQSLSLQMNPHFIFNTLNSIQLFILKCDVDSSLYYLSKFSNLMRKTLENSNRIKISLKEELDALTIYLDLEQLRSENKFAYKISCDNQINPTDTFIPNLLIQPFVENAIWHGIMPKVGTGNIYINITESGAYIKCSIVDDGIGRDKSRELKNSNTAKVHKSFATKIVNTRMQLLKGLYNKEFGLRYVDLTAEDGTPSGTEVIIIVPKNFETTKQFTLVDE